MAEKTMNLKSYSKKKVKKVKYESKAHELAAKQREISIAEFFEKNRHLLGFDNKRKALLTAIKEAVDNSLDACEEGGILPEIQVQVIDMSSNGGKSQDRFRIIVEDNGPGIVKKQIPNIFAKLLYGSKFHSLKQSRGQQGIGISAAALYGQLTTGKPIRIMSRVGEKYPAHYYELTINTQNNKPEIVTDEEKSWHKDHGTRLEIDLEGTYQKGLQSVDEYLKETAIVNPHVTIIYTNPKAEQIIFPRVSEKMPPEAKEIKPHPYGLELGMLVKMLAMTKAKTLQQFLTTDFSRVGSGTAKEICEKATLLPKTKPGKISRDMAEKLMMAIRETKIMNPSADCINPIGSELLEKGLKKEINAEFYAATTRPPSVYRGNPFQIEAALAYGGELDSEGSIRIMRFANRVPLLYQQGSCGTTEAVIKTNWRNYALSQSQNSLPQGPVVLLVHMASVWVPFTSEAKEALAHYPEIMKEIKLSIQEVGRELAKYLRKKKRVAHELTKRSYIEKYIPHIGVALQEILKITDTDKKKTEETLRAVLEKKRGKVEDMKFDPKKNVEYDEEFAKIGKESDDDE